MCRILITEDERIIAEDLKYTLKQFGHDVVGIASSGEEAINKIEETRPDVVLMDIMLDGDMTGIDTVRYMNDRFTLPVIYITAYADFGTLKEALDTDPNAFLLKPVREKQLYATIQIAMKKNS